MRPTKPTTSDVLIVAGDFEGLNLAGELVRSIGDGSPHSLPLLLTADASNGPDRILGEVLRQVRRQRPRALLACIGAEQTNVIINLITEMRGRCPKLAVLALTSAHSENLERAVRIAGASYYPIASDEDWKELSAALAALGVKLRAASAHSGLSPPRSRASPAPPPQARGRPRSYRH